MNKIVLSGITFDPGPHREIRLGGTQALIRQDIPGAGPVYQDMGPEEEPISWSGSLVGSQALATALALDALRKSGEVLELQTWLMPTRRVLIREFTWRLVRADRVDYDITLVVEGETPDFTPPPEVADENTPPAQAAAALTSATHVVAAGDTLWAIAERYMGDGSLWPAIAVANGITDPRTLRVGQVLMVPAASEAPALAARHQADLDRRRALIGGLITGMETIAPY